MAQMEPVNINAGLRIDVDTLRGTSLGVPSLLNELARHDTRASFFFSVGPDNMGRHIWRLLRPAFFLKMLRSRAASLYGWDILLKGTLWPGPLIGEKAGEAMRAAADAGHEIGLHCWDHYFWQARLESMSREEIFKEIERGHSALERIIGRPVNCAAAPGWRLTDEALAVREKFAFRYLSDCRGRTVFYPLLAGKTFKTPQIPVTLPTYDELIGGPGISADNYNEHLLNLFRADKLNVLAIHAEVEGISCGTMFADFMEKARTRRIDFQPLGRFLDVANTAINSAVVRGTVGGREGWVACQHEKRVDHAAA